MERKWTPTSMSDADASVSISDADALLDTRPLTYADISQRRASLVISLATSISVVVSALSVYVILLPLLLFTCSLKYVATCSSCEVSALLATQSPPFSRTHLGVPADSATE